MFDMAYTAYMPYMFDMAYTACNPYTAYVAYIALLTDMVGLHGRTGRTT